MPDDTPRTNVPATELDAVEARTDSKFERMLGEFRASNAELRGDFRAADAELRGDFRAEAAELRARSDARFESLLGETRASYAELNGRIDSKFAELNGKIDATRAELRGEITAVNARIEKLPDRATYLTTTIGIAIATLAVLVAVFQWGGGMLGVGATVAQIARQTALETIHEAK